MKSCFLGFELGEIESDENDDWLNLGFNRGVEGCSVVVEEMKDAIVVLLSKQYVMFLSYGCGFVWWYQR